MALDLGKAKKVLGETYVQDHQDLDEDRAAHLIVRAEQKIKALTEEKSQDEELNAAIQIKKDLESGYNNAIKHEQAKIQFLLSKIEEIQEGLVNEHASV